MEDVKGENRSVLNTNGSQISNFKLLKKSDIKNTVISNPLQSNNGFSPTSN